MINYYKPILLPSNGIPYDPIIHIREPNVSLLLAMRTNFLSNSENDIMFSIIKKFSSIESPENLYYKDIQYVWFLFLSMLNNSNVINIPHVCLYCNNSITIEINTSELELKYADNDVFKNKIFESNNFIFEFRKRLFKDNIITGLNNIGNEEILSNIVNFLKPQCIKIYYNNQEYDNDFLESALLEIGINDSSEIFNQLKKEEDWGLKSCFDHTCKKCKQSSEVLVSDPFRSSLYFAGISNKKIELLDNLLSIASFKIVSLNELLELPISLFESTVNNLTKIIKKKYGSKDSFDYLDYFEQELG
jgi:hypothetical protein